MTRIQLCGSLAGVPAGDWDALHDGRNPFVSHAFLAGLEQTGCLRERWGWRPRHVLLRGDDGQLLAAVPGYLKDNSHGEFVFDHAWAHAWAQHGLDYYPKWLGAVPYSPVTGPRLLGGARWHAALLQGIVDTTRDAGLSSAHINFHDADQDAAFADAWLPRIDVQYHWRNRDGWADFEAFLAALERKRRKNIRQERSAMARAGVRFRIVHGDEASPADLAAMYDFYLDTFTGYGNSPALTLDFLRHLATAMPRALVLILAELDGQTIAGALCLRGGDTLYGRYWGCARNIPGLHFETCYYQGIEYCLREGLTRFEPGAQGEHKITRGFLPVTVRSRHWIAVPAFAGALRRWCAEEAASVRGYKAMLEKRSPFRESGGSVRGDKPE